MIRLQQAERSSRLLEQCFEPEAERRFSNAEVFIERLRARNGALSIDAIRRRVVERQSLLQESTCIAY